LAMNKSSMVDATRWQVNERHGLRKVSEGSLAQHRDHTHR
jgi:hypothetical protein